MDYYKYSGKDGSVNVSAKERELERLSVNLSNLASYIEKLITIACELGSYWNEGNFEICQKIQKLLFPEGVKCDKENRRLLTESGNEFFDLYSDSLVSH